MQKDLLEHVALFVLCVPGGGSSDGQLGIENLISRKLEGEDVAARRWSM